MSEPLTKSGPDRNVVELYDLRKTFDGGVVSALGGVDLVVRQGEWVAITGPSGCGKSTLLHIVAALDAPTSGTARVFGQDVTKLENAPLFRRTQIGLVFQLHNLLPQLSAGQNVEIAMMSATSNRDARHRRARQLLADVDLAGQENRPPTKLSGGERQRVAIARALANDPPLLLADEPTGSLDTAAAERVTDLVRELRRKRPELTVIMVTHDQHVAAQADRIIRMRDGRIAADSG